MSSPPWQKSFPSLPEQLLPAAVPAIPSALVCPSKPVRAMLFARAIPLAKVAVVAASATLATAAAVTEAEAEEGTEDIGHLAFELD